MANNKKKKSLTKKILAWLLLILMIGSVLSMAIEVLAN